MIFVNWDKIKKYEKKPFALFAMLFLPILFFVYRRGTYNPYGRSDRKICVRRDNRELYKIRFSRKNRFFTNGDSYGIGKIKIDCPVGKQGCLTVCLKDDPTVCDSARISNSAPKKRRSIRRKQKLEHVLWSYPMQYDYYYGLIKRFAIYK